MESELLEQERFVLFSVQEYLNKNREFDKEKVISFISSRFRTNSININVAGINKHLKTLIDRKLIVEGSKLLRSDILNNPIRRSIYEFISSNPGVYHRIIVKELEVSNHVAVWHLKMLLKFDFIKKSPIGRYEVYYDSNMRFEAVRIKFYLNNPKVKQIIEHLKIEDIGVTRNQISEALHIHSNTIKKYLETLKTIGIISHKIISNKNLYFLNPGTI